jgi:hypothetical protein
VVVTRGAIASRAQRAGEPAHARAHAHLSCAKKKFLASISRLHALFLMRSLA